MSKLREALVLARPFVQIAYDNALTSGANEKTLARVKAKLATIDEALAEPQEDFTDKATVRGIETVLKAEDPYLKGIRERD